MDIGVVWVGGVVDVDGYGCFYCIGIDVDGKDILIGGDG